MTKRQLARRLRIERRAAELCLDPPRGLPHGQPARTDNGFSANEFKGWSIHYWDEHMRGAKEKWAKQLREVPKNDAQWAGWLAREMFKAGCGDEPPPGFQP